MINWIIKAMVWAGLGSIVAGVVDYGRAAQASGTPITASGVGESAKVSAQGFFSMQNLVRVLIVVVILAALAVFALPKLFPKFFKKPKK